MIVIGLTGSIAMGKTTVAKIFRDKKIPVFDADETVHQLYNDGTAAKLLLENFPDAVHGSIVDRQKLSAILLQNPTRTEKLEAIIHPLIHTARQNFLNHAKTANQPIVVLDIPLLFEMSNSPRVDITVVVSAQLETQRARALARPHMTTEKLDYILSRQIPDHQKRKRADHVIENNGTRAELEIKVEQFLSELQGKIHA